MKPIEKKSNNNSVGAHWREQDGEQSRPTRGGQWGGGIVDDRERRSTKTAGNYVK